ncbi:Inositol hexakisphosphate and diphosphoinositol-pentakisphosphate kinase [Eumeta japonica]|uniref:Inositol hexakisphosphate and diphosphoinositol-pentakisphosphate kinase n=1 Tax=Eumeta variegata TaxID=151549 RepID=A0A4C1ZYS6_EUMVA|nr:Inositol hexakisphosphate and diphosphoinositol-pentakisphosphate kinase [Eumeta japonica]
MRLGKALKEKRTQCYSRRDKVVLLHDNARPHVAVLVKNYLKTLNQEVLPHPPYSPGIAPSDYHLFRAKSRLHEAMQVDREFTAEDRARINPCESLSITTAMDFVKNPAQCCAHVHALIQQLVQIVVTKKDDPKTKDTILYHGETWELMGRRWGKIEKDFCTKNKTYDISKIPDIYDCIKYDLQHNQHTLQFDLAEELYIYAKYLADIVIPQEYGLTMQEKLTIGQGVCTPLLKKIRADLQRNIEESGEETVNRLNPRYSHGVSSPGRHVRTRLYFTSESHVHSLLTVLRFGGLLDVVKDEQWRRAMEYVSMVSELNYMSQIVVMLYEDPTKDPYSEERFHVELHFSPGVNCCVQKNLPPGPGFRPHSRNHSTTNNSSSSEEVKCIEEEGEEDQMASQETLQPDNDELDCIFISDKMSKSKIRPSDPIPICNLHYTVSGHEASTLAARLNAELQARSHTHGDSRVVQGLRYEPPLSEIKRLWKDMFLQKPGETLQGNSTYMLFRVKRRIRKKERTRSRGLVASININPLMIMIAHIVSGLCTGVLRCRSEVCRVALAARLAGDLVCCCCLSLPPSVV